MITTQRSSIGIRLALAGALAATCAVSCSKAPNAGADAAGTSTASQTHDEPPVDPSRIAVPAAVRQNLGITFVGAERRAIESTLRVPGRFELLPSAHTEYRTALAGQIEVHVEELQRVEAGQPLYTLSSPDLHDLQERLTETESATLKLQAELDAYDTLDAAHAEHESKLEETIELQLERVTQFEKLSAAGGGKMIELLDARTALAASRADLADAQEKDAEIHISQTKNIVGAEGLQRLRVVLLGSLSADTGLTVADLLAEVPGTDGVTGPRWRSLTEVIITAAHDGRVESLSTTTGAWVDERAPVLTMVQPHMLRFRGTGLQSDLGDLSDGLTAHIVAPSGSGTGGLQGTMAGPLQIGLGADPSTRTIDLFVKPKTLTQWARPGVTAQMEILVSTTAATELAIPMAAVRQDGLDAVFFRRNPKNPAEVIRVVGDFGANDGRWISVLSGLRDGDEVVMEGSFQLMLATSGSMQKGGHFHADGTFHEGDH